MNTVNLKYHNEKNTDTLDILLHGSSGGMNYSLMQKIFDVCIEQCRSVVNFNFPYFERGDEHSFGLELKEEIETLQKVLTQCKADKYKHIRLIGKSLGGVIAARFVSRLDIGKQKKYSVVVFGYVTGKIDLKKFFGKIVVIQGERDRFGNIEVVKKDLENAISNDTAYFEILNADHSYRNEQNIPIYEEQAIEIFGKV